MEARPYLRGPPGRGGVAPKNLGNEGQESKRLDLPWHCTSESRDGETGRTGGREAENKGGLRGRCHRLAPARAHSIMARGREPHPRGRRYVCSPDLHALASALVPVPRRYGRVKATPPSAAALRAALTWPTHRGLWPGRDEGLAFVASTTISQPQRRSREEVLRPDLTFLLTEESRYLVRQRRGPLRPSPAF